MLFFTLTWVLLLYAALGLGSVPFARPVVPLWLLALSLFLPPLFFFVLVYALVRGGNARLYDRSVGRSTPSGAPIASLGHDREIGSAPHGGARTA